MASHLASLWNRGLRQLESGQVLRIGSHLASLIPNQTFPVEPLIQIWELSQQRIPPVILFFLLLFFCNSVFAGFVFCKIKTNFASFFFPLAGDYVIIVEDVTSPPFLDVTLAPAFLHVKVTQKKRARSKMESRRN